MIPSYVSGIGRTRSSLLIHLKRRETQKILYVLQGDPCTLTDKLYETEEAYMKACLEYQKHPAVANLEHPVKHQAGFVSLLKRDLSSFVVRGQAENLHLHALRRAC